MEELAWNYDGGIHVVVPFGGAIAWHLLNRFKGQSEGRNQMLKILSRVLPFFLCLLSCSGTQIFQSILITYDVNGKWIERGPADAFLPLIMIILRFTAVLIVLDRLHRIYEHPEYNRSTAWAIFRRVCYLWLLYGGCGGMINLMLPAIVFDDVISCCVDFLEEAGATEKMPALLTSCLDFVFFVPHFVKSVQLTVLFLRESEVVTAIASLTCVLHNSHVLYMSFFNGFLDYLAEWFNELRAKDK